MQTKYNEDFREEIRDKRSAKVALEINISFLGYVRYKQRKAAKNVEIVRPYIMNLIIDAMRGGEEIGNRYTNNQHTAYRPDSGPLLIKLRKL